MGLFAAGGPALQLYISAEQATIRSSSQSSARIGNDAAMDQKDVWIPLFGDNPSTDGSLVLRDGGDWTSAEATVSGGDLATFDSFLVQARICGTAEAAGISFGPYKDFLTPIDAADGNKLLQLDVDTATGRWGFRVDGLSTARTWWDSAIASVDDIVNGVLTLKAKQAQEVRFDAVTVTRLESSCRLTVVLTCYRFAQRLRLALASWCRQHLPSGGLEVIVVNPGSPDSTHQIVAAMAEAYPDVRVRELEVDAGMARNKGWMINRGLEAAQGEWVWLTDADCVFPPDAAARLFDQCPETSSLVYGERRHLTASVTDALLAGHLDPANDFEHIASTHHGTPDIYPWGFTQIVHRSLVERIRYREDLDHFADSDGSFLNACRTAGMRETRLEGVMCLHLAHPFAWYGTNLDL